MVEKKSAKKPADAAAAGKKTAAASPASQVVEEQKAKPSAAKPVASVTSQSNAQQIAYDPEGSLTKKAATQADPVTKDDGKGPIVNADTPLPGVGAYNLTISGALYHFLNQHSLSIAFTTYALGKVLFVGPGRRGRPAVCERNYRRAMALCRHEERLFLSTQSQIWTFHNSLPAGKVFDKQWDRLYLPRTAHVSAGVDIHDLHIDKDNRLLSVVTQYNCLATHDDRGSFNPIWRPPFIDKIIGEDRCHLNGLCLENGEPAYVTIVGETNSAGAWREKRRDGGIVMDVRDNSVLATGLSMPHTPRLHQNKLWVLEAGSGYFGSVDRKTGKFDRAVWCPGFLRGLRFFGDYAFIAMSLPRDKTFAGLPLDEELKRRNTEPQCGICIVDLRTMERVHTMGITGSVVEIYDIELFPGIRQPLMIGLQGRELQRFVFLGPDATTPVATTETGAAA